jgi:cytochrome c peroxidase
MRTLSLTLLLAAVACDEPAPPAEAPATEAAPEATGPDAAALRSRASAVLGQLPEAAPRKGEKLTDERIDLGRRLYYETQLSLAGDLSCNSCHDLAKYGVDGQPTSPGHKGQLGGRNSPTVYNAALHFTQFWDGRAADVEEQAKGPVLNPIEMAMPDEKTVVQRLKKDATYGDAFKAAFPDDADPITYDNMAKAIGAFERRLITPSPFDAFLAGDDAALTEVQLAGLETYLDTGCTTCHNGALLGGSMYQKLGLVKPYEDADKGRAEVTGNDADLQMFKVPSLRNIDKTGPYFHNGQVASLDEAIRLMATHQLGKELSKEEVASISAFLSSLTGEIPTEYIALAGTADAKPAAAEGAKGAKGAKGGKAR